MGFRQLYQDPSCVFAFPLSNQPLQEARDRHVVTGNPTVERSPWGNALVFDGINDYVTLGADWDYPLRFDSGSQDFSIVMWVRRTSDTADIYTLIDKRDGNNDGWLVRINPNYQIYSSVNDTDVSGPIPPSATLDWRCIVFAVDRSGNGLTYVDGVPRTPVAMSGIAIATTTAVRIGAESYGAAANRFSGAMAGVGIFNRVLSATEAGDLAGV